jgi:hypothetical protein
MCASTAGEAACARQRPRQAHAREAEPQCGGGGASEVEAWRRRRGTPVQASDEVSQNRCSVGGNLFTVQDKK